MTISIWLVLAILVAHWWADFTQQTDEMAIGKSSSNWWLTIHVGVYAAWLTAVLLCFGWLWFKPFQAMVWLFVNIILHWVTDWFTSRWTTRLWKAERRHDFFVVIGVDQLIHAATLLTSAALLSHP